MESRVLLWVFLFTVSSATSHFAQKGNYVHMHEQSDFSMEQEIVPIKRPVPIPADVLHILRANEYVLQCLETGQSREDIPASWFTGSEIHLNGPREVDLVVQPRILLRAPNACLFGANVARFWLFRKMRAGHELILDESAHDLKVLATKRKGFRNVQTISMTVDTVTTLTFRFDGKRYRLFQKKSKSLP